MATVGVGFSKNQQIDKEILLWLHITGRLTEEWLHCPHQNIEEIVNLLNQISTMEASNMI